MAILINENTRVLVQGITGKVGAFQSITMKAYGTNIVAGVTPGKGGLDLDGIPIYDLVSWAILKWNWTRIRSCRRSSIRSLMSWVKKRP